MAMNFTQIRIINTKTQLEKIIDIDDYNPADLNAIVAFYKDHDEYSLERI